MLWTRFLFVLVMFAMMPVTSLAQEEDDDQLTHVVQPGENLYRIALRYGVSMDALVQANNIANQQRIVSGQELVIPGLSVPDDSDSVVNPLVAAEPTTHVVQRGESLTIIANRYGVTVEEIMESNSIDNANRIYPGQSLNIWAPEAATQPDAAQEAPVERLEQNMPYIIQRGETLSQIAQRHGTDWRTLAQMNGILDPSRIEAGQEIMVPAVNANGGAIDMGIMSMSVDAPAPTITQGKQIIVDLSDSRVYAYDDGVLVYSSLASMGRPATPTVVGDFTIIRRVRSQTMSGPGYSLPNVEWVLYFYRGYALHGTYWHNNFGQPMSHGCVNLTNADARWFYENFGQIGTPVRVQQ